MRRLRRFRVFLACLVAAQAVVPPVHADWALFRGLTTVQKLARQIDRVEAYLDDYGTVVPKTPDVWGQARLTKFRVDYEDQMKSQLSQFKATLNGALSRSDQSYLTNALTLQAALGGSPAGGSVPSSTVVESSQQSVLLDRFGRPIRGIDGQPTIGTSTSQQAVPTTTFVQQALPELGSDPLSPASFNTSSLVREQQIIGFGTDQKISLEPTVHLDQMSRYLQHLNELRRINDGDDQADSPGYALHLVRIPVSVLPGARTRQGYGAEVTITAKPHLHAELLPQTVRGLVVNDLVDQFAFPMANFLDAKNAAETLDRFDLEKDDPTLNHDALKDLVSKVAVVPDQLIEGKKEEVRTQLTQIRLITSALIEEMDGAKSPDTLKLVASLQKLMLDIDKFLPQINQRVDSIAKQWALVQDANEQTVNDAIGGIPSTLNPAIMAKAARLSASGVPKKGTTVDQISQALQSIQNDISGAPGNINVLLGQIQNARNDISAQLTQIQKGAIGRPAISATPSRRAQQPFPITQVFDVYGSRELGFIALEARRLKADPLNQPHSLLLDLQKFFAEEFNSAYDYLVHRPELWMHANPQLASAVRLKDENQLKCLRQQFLDATEFRNPASNQRHTFALAWAIIVESALLNERLIEDMRQLASSKNAFHISGEGMCFIGSCPDPVAREAFNQYVACRWPLHVFAVDPITQDQNIADAFSMRREIQLSLSLAMASGRIGAQNFTKMARRLELDMETIALNRTIVGFSHGDDTFGWRFLPRVQSPDTHSNIRTWAELLVCGGPNRDMLLRQHRLEPGVRECTAIVLMPSFVPYVIFDTRTNWFKLTNPSRKQMTLTDGVDLSAEVTCLRELSSQCTTDAHLYRPDEVYRLTRAVEQLDRRLPLQTSYVPMPYENSLGGFEFFSTGTGDLAPELKGFYGESGILAGVDGDSRSSLFLLGDHFSVHETEVVVGNQRIGSDHFKLLSRQVMRVDVPTNVSVEDGDLIDCHVATPYGISNHLLIPAYGRPKPPEPAPKEGPVLFDWTAPEGLVQLVLDSNRNVCSVRLQSELGLEDKGNSPFPFVRGETDPPEPPSETQLYELRAFVDLKRKTEEKPERVSRLRLVVPFVGRVGDLPRENGGGLLEVAILNALQKERTSIPEDAEALVIQGFLRAIEPNHSDGQPVIPLESPLVLKVKLCEPQCPNPVSGCPTCPAPQSSGGPAPAPVPLKELPADSAPRLPSNAPGPGAFLPTLPRAAAQPIGERASRSTPEWRRVMR